MKKKNEFLVIFMIFQLLEIMEKKNFIYNEKRKFFFEQKNFDGLLPILYCEEGARQGWVVLQYSAQLCHNIITVAATQGAAGRWGAQAGTAGVRGRWAWRAGRRAWARGQAAAARGRSGRVGMCGRRDVGELGVRGRRGAGAGRERQARRGRAGHWAWARGLGAWAGQDCALGAPDLIFKPVFDSVFFLSQ